MIRVILPKGADSDYKIAERGGPSESCTPCSPLIGMDRIVFHNYRSWMHTLFACICLRVPHILDGPPLGVQLIKEFLMLMSIDVSSYCGRALSSGFRTITRRWIKGSSIVALSGLGQNVSADVAWAYDGADLGAHNATTINAEKVLKVKGEIPRASGTRRTTYVYLPTSIRPPSIRMYARTYIRTYMHACMHACMHCHTSMVIHTSYTWMDDHGCICAYIDISIYIYYIYICVCVCMYMYIYIWKPLAFYLYGYGKC